MKKQIRKIISKGTLLFVGAPMAALCVTWDFIKKRREKKLKQEKNLSTISSKVETKEEGSDGF